ncbi:DUF1501 domain-containing protein [Shewanella abyssi]|uniref:DUF1501 domain-containing protein n=1 Tax=Shewanella abyssi TaxID=311789 RepID=UPI0031FEEB23
MCFKGGLSLSALTSFQLQAIDGLINSSQQLDDYKALVCIYLKGGNDSLNMLLPMQAEPLQNYLASRQDMAITEVTPISPLTTIEGGIGIPNSLSPLHTLFDQQRLAFVANVGSLITPLTLTQYKAKNAAIPKHLFSHNSQQATSMLGGEQNNTHHGWGAKLLEGLNSHHNFATNISLGGQNIWQTGDGTAPHSLSRSGALNIRAFTKDDHGNSFREQLINLLSEQQHPLKQAHQQALWSAIDNNDELYLALTASEEGAIFSNTLLSKKLQMVAKMISVNSKLNVKRQLFFVDMGGFDTHDNQVEKQPQLFSELANAMVEFDNAMQQQGMQDSVTSFTLSDFARSLSSNGDGTDHAWAGNQMVMGGAVNGGDIYGKLASFSLNSEFDVGGGRFIPQIANEQYFATLAKWYGASDSMIQDIFPTLSNFDNHYLGFI